MVKKIKYDSCINVLGSIPNYGVMLEFICEYMGKKIRDGTSIYF